MTGENLTLGIAFLAGLLSFFAPCVTVLVPAFLSHLAGVSLTNLQKERKQMIIFINTIFFIIGFTFVFVLLGASIGFLSTFVRGFQVWLSRIGGLVIMYLGLSSLRLVPFPFARLHFGLPTIRSSSLGYASSAVVGSAFAIGWTPCVGPVLAAILVLAGTTGSITSGITMLLAYSIGLMLPFLLVGLFTAKASSFLSRHGKLINTLNIIGGVILIALGILVFTNNFALLVGRLYFLSPFRL